MVTVRTNPVLARSQMSHLKYGLLALHRSWRSANAYPNEVC